MEEYMIDNSQKVFHLIGIGGISMSAIAQMLKDDGNIVTGSDKSESKQIEILKNKGIDVVIGHDVEKVRQADIVIYTAAIPEDDEELVEARKLKKDIYERAEFLGIHIRQYKNSIGVAGTHGKTTTTSMISNIFLKAGLNPTIQVGALLKEINSNYNIGDGENFIFESCEYKDSFLNFYPTSTVITNVDEDHMEYFKTLENILISFKKYIMNIQRNGKLYINLDDENSKEVLEYASYNRQDLEKVTFGIENDEAEYQARDIEYVENSEYILKFTPYKNGVKMGEEIHLKISGKVNIANAIAAIAVADKNNIAYGYIKAGLEGFTGASRRFEYKGMVNGARIYDDYAHHPTEIKALSEGISHIPANRKIAIFEAHTYSRVINHKEDFAKSLSNFDIIIATKIYASREVNTHNITAEEITNILKESGKNAIYLDTNEKIKEFIKKEAKQGDIIITIGAGDVTKIGDIIKD